jgi:hypothetical protein
VQIPNPSSFEIPRILRHNRQSAQGFYGNHRAQHSAALDASQQAARRFKNPLRKKRHKKKGAGIPTPSKKLKPNRD